MQKNDCIWYGMVWYGMVWYGMVWYGMVWCGVVWCGVVWYGMVYGISPGGAFSHEATSQGTQNSADTSSKINKEGWGGGGNK